MAGFKYKAPAPEALQQRASQSIGNFEGFIRDEYTKFTAKKGDNAIRVLPRHENEDARYYGEEVYVHYSIGVDKASVLCNYKMFGQPCCVCEERARAERRGDEETVDALKYGKRVIMWIVDRKDESKGPQVFDAPPTVDRDIAKAAKSRETGVIANLDHPELGRDIYFDRDGEGKTTKYGGYQLGSRATSVEEKWLDFITDNPLREVLRLRDYEEVKALFEGGKVAEEPRREEPRREARQETQQEQRTSSRPALTRPTERQPDRSDDSSVEKDRAFLEGKGQEEPPFDGGKTVESAKPDTPKQDDPKPEPSTLSAGAQRAAELRAKFAAKNKAG